MTVSDPDNVNARLYKQIARLLDQLEAWDDTITIPQRINALIAVGRIQIMFSNLRKAANVESADAGSAVRKYALAFQKPHAVGRRKTAAGTFYQPLPDDAESDSFEGDDGDDAA